MGAKNLSFNILILFSIFAFTSVRADDCIFGIFVQTGSIKRAGTHSVISLTLSTPSGQQLVVPNLEDWGIMGPGYNYFEVGNMDIFAVKGECLSGPICVLELTSDGSGPYSGWYCDYVDVTMFGAQNGTQKECSQQHFTVEQWLATDTAPYKLNATVDACLRGGSKRVSDGLISSVV